MEIGQASSLDRLLGSSICLSTVHFFLALLDNEGKWTWARERCRAVPRPSSSAGGGGARRAPLRETWYSLIITDRWRAAPCNGITTVGATRCLHRWFAEIALSVISNAILRCNFLMLEGGGQEQAR